MWWLNQFENKNVVRLYWVDTISGDNPQDVDVIIPNRYVHTWITRDIISYHTRQLNLKRGISYTVTRLPPYHDGPSVTLILDTLKRLMFLFCKSCYYSFRETSLYIRTYCNKRLHKRRVLNNQFIMSRLSIVFPTTKLSCSSKIYHY